MSLEQLRKASQHPERRFLCVEVNPPRGFDVEPTLQKLEGRLAGVDFLNVTDSALARMKMAPIPFASVLKQRYKIDPLVNLSCRDRNLIAMQGDLLAGWMTGIRSVVALTGDAVTIGDSPERKGVFEVNSVGLLNVIAALNSGRDFSGNPLKEATDYVAGVVVNPNARNWSAEIRRLAKKKEAGAVYALSQPVFEEEATVRFFREARSAGVPILMGLLPFKTLQSARAIAKIPGIRLPAALQSEIEKAGEDRDFSAASFDTCMRIARAASPHVIGFHVISGAGPKLALDLAAELAGMIKGG